MKWGTANNADFGPYQSTVKFRNGLDSSAENLFDARDVNNFKGFFLALVDSVYCYGKCS